ncbi:dTDP-4-dehydrorhamnose reductase [soil metagenome]
MPYRIAVFGANGQLGSDLSRLIAARDDLELIALSRPSVDAFDLASTRERLKDLSFDAAINCVAATRVDDCETDANSAVAINAEFAALAAELCAARDARLVQVSTDYVFGGQTERRPLDERVAIAPLNVYGATKALGESLAAATNPETLVVRVAALFGVAGASGKGGNFVETMIRLGRERGAIRVVDDQHISPTSTYDAAEAIVQLLRRRAPAGVYHVSNGGEATWFELAKATIERLAIQAEVTPITSAEFPTPARRPPYSILDSSKAATVIGRPLRHWREALDHYLVAKSYL